MDGIGELIEKLCIANLKLWAVCDQKDAYAKSGEPDAEKLRDLMKKDLDLCKLRAELRKEINLRLGGPQGDNVKCYGKGDARQQDAVARCSACGDHGSLLPGTHGTFRCANQRCHIYSWQEADLTAPPSSQSSPSPEPASPASD